MIRVEVIEKFSLEDFDKLKNIERKSVAQEGKLFVGDTFECDEEMLNYLTKANKLGKAFVKVIEVKPETKATVEYNVEEEPKAVVKPSKKDKKKKK